MKKLKKQNINNILNIVYRYLNKEKNLYETNILLNINQLTIIEFQNINLYLPKSFDKNNILFTIKQKYNTSLLLNYDLSFLILFLFHNLIIKKILQQKNKKIKAIFIIKKKKQIQNFSDFYKNKIKNEFFFQKNSYFFILFGYIFSIKNNNNFYFKIKKKYFLLNNLKKKKKNILKKKNFTFFLLQEDNLKCKIINIKKKKNIYILSRIEYLKKKIIK